MVRLILAICTAVAVGGAAGCAWFWRWLRGDSAVPDYVPESMVAAVFAEDGWL